MRTSRGWSLPASALPWVIMITHPAYAGMPSFRLSEVTSARLEVVSFFIVLYLLMTFALKVLWNTLSVDFPRLPRLTFKSAFGLMLICGLFLYLILTMIAGARELMTPGAWVKNGATYRPSPDEMPKVWLAAARQQSLERLRTALWDYARKHEGRFPPHVEAEDFPRELWLGVDPARSIYGYYPDARPDQGEEIVVFEPIPYGAERYVLLSNGTILKMPVGELTRRATEQLKAKYGAERY